MELCRYAGKMQTSVYSLHTMNCYETARQIYISTASYDLVPSLWHSFSGTKSFAFKISVSNDHPALTRLYGEMFNKNPNKVYKNCILRRCSTKVRLLMFPNTTEVHKWSSFSVGFGRKKAINTSICP